LERPPAPSTPFPRHRGTSGAPRPQTAHRTSDSQRPQSPRSPEPGTTPDHTCCHSCCTARVSSCRNHDEVVPCMCTRHVHPTLDVRAGVVGDILAPPPPPLAYALRSPQFPPTFHSPLVHICDPPQQTTPFHQPLHAQSRAALHRPASQPPSSPHVHATFMRGPSVVGTAFCACSFVQHATVG